MDNYFLLHGSFADPKSNWLPWLKSELEKQNKTVIVPLFPCGVGIQSYDSWKKVLDGYMPYINKNTIFVAHSSSPVFLCQYLLNHNIRAKKLIFVCGFNNTFGISPDYDGVNKTFYIDNLSEIKDLCNDIVCIYSNDDPYVPQDELQKFADEISNEKICIENGGHLNTESGYTEFPELLKLL